MEVDDAILRTDYWYFSYAQMQASDDFQREELVGENIQVFELGYNWRFSKYGNVVLGFDFLVVDDESKVEVKVSYEGDSTATEDSEIKGFAVPIEIGASYITDNNKIELGANVGYRFFHIKRSIDIADGYRCPSCPSDDIDVDTGLYFRPYIKLKITKKSSLGLSTSIVSDDEQLDGYTAISLSVATK